MKSKTDLYQLIKAMSKSEKRYFTLDAQKSGRKDARYLELFQAINDMESYDEAPLKAHFGKTLPTDKAYLYEAILRSMRDYRSANSYAARIKEMIMDAKYLYERGLYEQSEERLNTAKELAEELGDQLSILELNKEHRRLLKDTRRPGYEKELQDLIIEKQNNLNKLEEELTYLDIHDELLLEIRQHRQGLMGIQKEDLKARYQHLDDITIQEPSTIQSKLRFYQCMALFHQLLNEHSEVYNNYTKLINCWDTSPKYKTEEFYRYVLDMSNLIHILLSDNSKASEINYLLSKLEKERPANLHDQSILFQRVTSFRILYSINTGDFADVQTLVKRIEKGLKQYDISSSTELSITFNISILLFMAAQFSLCQDWIERIIQPRKIMIRQDIQTAGKILYLLATYELGEFEATETCLRNTTRYLQKLDQKENDFYINVLSSIRKLHQGTVKSIQIMNQLKEYIITLRNKKVNIPLGLDELVLFWLDGKLSKRSISEIIKSNLRKNNVTS
ncbi:MAG: hypothetical protein ACK4TA_12045 [Saprospiraceae bacterium]